MLAYGRVLVAHSWGGTVISEAGMDPKVTALVYVAARAPDAGEDFVALSGKFPTLPVRAGVQDAMASPIFPRKLSSNISRTVSRTKRQKSFMPNNNPPPPLCSAGGPQWLLGAPNRAGMRSRNSIRRYRLTWNDFWQHA
jgi:pimeloyl-ACP methyl ester carboxylesterase